MKRDAFANIAPAAGQRAFSGQAHARIARCDRRVVAHIGEMLHFAHERIATAERIGIDEL